MSEPTAKQAVDVFVQRIMHDAHLRYQRQQLAKDKASTGVNGLPCPEQRGCRREMSTTERRKRETFDLAWFTGLRQNFYKAYFDTLHYMAQ